ncbi:MAG: ribosome-associated translation inhibitor RaiA [Kineosporiaceae bacterium]
MEIVITGRRLDVPERFRRLAEEKLAKVGQLAPRAHRVDVEVSHERNPRQASTAEKVEITVRDKGPVIRAEASAEDPLAALDLAFGKLLERLRRTRDRRKVHHGRQTPATLRQSVPADLAPLDGNTVISREEAEDEDEEQPLDDSPVVIRTKDHAAIPMTLDQALYEMELVGHDFFLFVDADSGLPSVVYRRRGWNYGVIRLRADDLPAGEQAQEVPVPAGS